MPQTGARRLPPGAAPSTQPGTEDAQPHPSGIPLVSPSASQVRTVRARVSSPPVNATLRAGGSGSLSSRCSGPGTAPAEQMLGLHLGEA